MLGWNISVFRQTDGGSSPARADSEKGVRLTVLQADLGGLRWLDELVKTGLAIDLGGPPEANSIWGCGPDDIISSKWEGKTVINRAAVDDCQPDEWLLVVAFDES